MVYCAILAGGIGSRMGTEMPKQYLMLSGKPVIVHTIESFLSVDKIDQILVLCPDDWVEYTKGLIEKSIIKNEKLVVLAGGKTRNDTIIEAIDYIKKIASINENDILITHDAARPFVSGEIIEDNITYGLQYGACSTYVNAVDTIAISKDGKVVSEVTDRSQMYQTQTPQTFGVLELEEMLGNLSEEEKEKYTDAVGIGLAAGKDVYMVKGDYKNIKITYPHDLVVAEAILKAQV